MSSRPPATSFLHRAQVALARRHLRTHLAEALTLQQVARAAAASPSHFARLYRAFTGETPFRTLTRYRLEAAARRLAEAPREPVSSVALDTGWATPSSLDKAFRAAFGCSPTQYRRRPPGERPPPPPAPRGASAGGFRLSPRPRLTEALPFPVAFVREQGEYSEVSAPLAWLRLDRCLLGAGCGGHLRVGAASDDPRQVWAEALRYEAGVVLDPGQAPPPGTEAATWGGGLHAVFEFRGPYRCIAAGFDALFRRWHQRGWPPLRDAPSLELYRGRPGQGPEAELLTELWIPVEA